MTASGANGRVTRKQLPRPTVDSSVSRPPWASAIQRAIGRPSPAPVERVSSRTNRSKIRSCSWAGMPSPSSVMRIVTSVGVRVDRRRDGSTELGVSNGIVQQVADHLTEQACCLRRTSPPRLHTSARRRRVRSRRRGARGRIPRSDRRDKQARASTECPAPRHGTAGTWRQRGAPAVRTVLPRSSAIPDSRPPFVRHARASPGRSCEPRKRAFATRGTHRP